MIKHFTLVLFICFISCTNNKSSDSNTKNTDPKKESTIKPDQKKKTEKVKKDYSINYDGEGFKVGKSKVKRGKFKKPSCKSISIDFMFKPTKISNYKHTFNDSHPYMPLRLDPLMVYVNSENNYLFRVEDQFDTNVKVNLNEWNLVSIKYDQETNLIEVKH